MDLDRDELMQAYLADADENLRAMEEALIDLEASPEDAELVRTIFRGAHTLKGNASCLGFDAVTDYTHRLEDFLEKLIAGAVRVNTPMISLLLQIVDALRAIVPDSVAGSQSIAPEHQALVARLSAFGDVPAGMRPDPFGIVSSSVGQQARSAERARTLRVDTDKLDRLLNLTGEIAISRGRMRQMLDEYTSRSADVLVEAHRESDRLHIELQELVMKLRMVPVGPTFRQFVRTVRDLAPAHGKDARLVIEGADVEVDTTVLENLKDPLTHLVRNAIDHGIEPPDVRVAAGKERVGVLRLSAAHDAGTILIRLSDDGGGINRRRVADRAVAMGHLDAERWDDATLFRMLFEPGFTTAEAVSDLSGRGIGMDVVRRNIEALHGTIDVESVQGAGTTITMRLPLTVAIIDGFAVGVDGETYIMPLDCVVECLELPAGEGSREGSQGVINLRGEALPYLRLRNLFDASDSGELRENVVIVRYGGKLAGIAVDALYGEHQTVIKPLGVMLKGTPGISGSAILGTGRVALILDLNAIFKQIHEANEEHYARVRELATA